MEAVPTPEDEGARGSTGQGASPGPTTTPRANLKLIMLVAVIAAGVNGVYQAILAEQASQPSSPAVQAWTPAVEASYTMSCEKAALDSRVSQAAALAYCACTLRAVEARYTPDELAAVIADYQSGKPLPDKMVEVGAACLASR